VGKTYNKILSVKEEGEGNIILIYITYTLVQNSKFKILYFVMKKENYIFIRFLCHRIVKALIDVGLIGLTRHLQ